MPLLDFYKNRWKQILLPRNDWKWEKESCFNGLTYKQSFLRQIKPKKSKDKFKCRICDKFRGKGTRYVGDNYHRVCQFCFEEWFDKSAETLKKMINLIKKTKKESESNKDKWQKEALIGALTIADDSTT